MDFLIYHQLKDASVLHCMISNLENTFEDVYACGDLVTIKDGRAESSPESVIRCLKNCLNTSTLAKEDVLYIFFAAEDKKMKLWPLKRAGRSKMHRLEADFPYYQI
ncbi:MAG: hypothetical protein ACTHLE_05655 [Agriterribacter sp.]